MKNYFCKELYDYNTAHGYSRKYLTDEEATAIDDNLVTPYSEHYGTITKDNKIYTVRLGDCVLD